MITKFDSQSIRLLDEKVGKSLEVIAEEFGLVLRKKSSSYLPWKTPIAFEFYTEDGLQELNNISERSYGTSSNVIGKKFRYSNHEYEITGISPNRPKYPLDVKRLPDGKKFKFPPQFAVQAI